MVYEETYLIELKNRIAKEKRIILELNFLFQSLKKEKDTKGKRMISSQINLLKESLKITGQGTARVIESLSAGEPPEEVKKVEKKEETLKKKLIEKISPRIKLFSKKMKTTYLERQVLRRLKKKRTKIKLIKKKKPNKYVQISNNLFKNTSMKMFNKWDMSLLKRDLIKANLQFAPLGYLSVILFTTLLSIIAGFLIFLFFLFFNVGSQLPIITLANEGFFPRFLKVFWIILVVPLGTFLLMYFYPSLEKKSAEHKINEELPFVTIHMDAISGSMVEPSKIFSIIISTEEYPAIKREFTKLLNEINIYGYDLVTALRDTATKTPSNKLAELFNGLAVTITSGGSLSNFFEKRAESLLFDYRLEREKYTKTAETFMDIYISVVIAAPMIFMLLLMMMKISGLGLALSTSMISLIMVLGVSMINIVFMTFLHLKQPKE